MIDRCRKCGYLLDVHDADTKQCPVCACGEVPRAHLTPTGAERYCPALCMTCGGRTPLGEAHEHRPYRLGEKGEPLSLRRGRYEQADDGPAPIEERVARIISCITRNLPPVLQAAQLAEPEYLVPVREPMVFARPPANGLEIAGYGGKQAVGLGRAGQERGWFPIALYWRAADGEEGCGVWLSRQDLRALATWKRPSTKAGTKSGWAVDIAYAWRVGSGTFPFKITHTALEGLL